MDDPRLAAVARHISPGGFRMRASRERRRNAMFCILLDVRYVEIDRLVELGFIDPAGRNDRRGVELGLYRFLDAQLGGAHR